VAVVLVVLALVAGPTFAQSSGNFTYGNTGNTHCVLNDNGRIRGGSTCSQKSVCTADASGATVCTIVPGDQDCAGSLSAGIKTSNGAGNVFVIRPSAVIGLLTDVTVQKSATINVGTSSAMAGVDFEVVVTDPKGKPAKTIPDYPITYAARFVQISTNLFDVLGDLCTMVSDSNAVGGVTTAQGCYISFNESTVSAHSFDWLVPTLNTGTYTIAANWKASLGNTGISESLTCVGPVNLSVQQNKVFSFNTIN
jgi:hypothetical protein